MSLYIISDFHLSLNGEKPMDIFGNVWQNHTKKIEQNWQQIINNNDVVIIAGDISWAKNEKDLLTDLNFIHNLNGEKIITKGNHDYWWNSTDKLNNYFDDITFIKKGSFEFDNISFCVTRGWICPNDSLFTKHDEKIYLREVNRLKFALENVRYKDNIYAVLHFPPTNDKKESSLFTELLEFYKVKKVYYGHLHGENSFNTSLKGKFNDIEYNLISGDYLNFMPLKIT